MESKLKELFRQGASGDPAAASAARARIQSLVSAEAAKRLGESAGSGDLRRAFGRLPPQEPCLRDASERVQGSDEVNEGFSLMDALLEANRCLQCPSPFCQTGRKAGEAVTGGCPVGLRVAEFIEAFRSGDIRGAYHILDEDNPLHPVTARVCPQDEQCQKSCALCGRGAIGIGLLERIVGDLYEDLFGREVKPGIVPIPLEKDFPVALIGSGPASLTAAMILARKGYRRVCIFEAFHRAAGVLRYGIPPFRLPRKVIDGIIRRLEQLGVRIITGAAVGRTLTISDLRRMGFRAFFIGTGAGLPVFMNIPGEALNGVISANEFLTRCNLMAAGDMGYDTPVFVGRKVVVIGGGNVAMDAARWALRLAAQKYGAGNADVIVLYRRTRAEMPTRTEEIAHAEKEGVRFEYLSLPEEFLEGDNAGWVGRIRCRRMTMTGEKEPDGRHRVKPVDGDGGAFEIHGVDTVIEALGTRPNALLSRQNPGLDADDGRIIVRDAKAGLTGMEGVFAGGDAVRGGATVILAMGDGKNAAAGIDAWLNTLPPEAHEITLDPRLENMKEWFLVREAKALCFGQTKDGRKYAIREMKVYAPLVAERAAAGQFVIVMADAKGERVPLTIADWDRDKGEITFVFQEVGSSTFKMGALKPGHRFFSVLGPLGHSSVVETLPKGKSVFVIGGGVGIAPVYPIARAHHRLGNRVVSIIGARNKGLMFWQEKMRAVSDELHTTFDEQGEFVTHALERILDDPVKRASIAHIVAVGPVAMMESVYKTTERICREAGADPVRVVVSVNPTMMDGTGMCGGCRLLVAGSAKYGCVDGPEFDASLVDFEMLKRRQAMYTSQERRALDTYMNNYVCAERTLG